MGLANGFRQAYGLTGSHAHMVEQGPWGQVVKRTGTSREAPSHSRITDDVPKIAEIPQHLKPHD